MIRPVYVLTSELYHKVTTDLSQTRMCDRDSVLGYIEIGECSAPAVEPPWGAGELGVPVQSKIGSVKGCRAVRRSVEQTTPLNGAAAARSSTLQEAARCAPRACRIMAVLALLAVISTRLVAAVACTGDAWPMTDCRTSTGRVLKLFFALPIACSHAPFRARFSLAALAGPSPSRPEPAGRRCTRHPTTENIRR